VLAEGTLIVPGSQGDVAARTSEAKKVVGRDGIEPPTPGFSDRAPRPRDPHQLAELEEIAGLAA